MSAAAVAATIVFRWQCFRCGRLLGLFTLLPRSGSSIRCHRCKTINVLDEHGRSSAG